MGRHGELRALVSFPKHPHFNLRALAFFSQTPTFQPQGSCILFPNTVISTSGLLHSFSQTPAYQPQGSCILFPNTHISTSGLLHSILSSCVGFRNLSKIPSGFTGKSERGTSAVFSSWYCHIFMRVPPELHEGKCPGFILFRIISLARSLVCESTMLSGPKEFNLF